MRRYGQQIGIVIFFVQLTCTTASGRSYLNFSGEFIFEEGTSNQICCTSLVPLFQMWILHENRTVLLTCNKLKSCYTIKKVTSKDAGNYTCFGNTTYRGLQYEKGVLVVIDPKPMFNNRIHFPLNQSNRTLTCSCKNTSLAIKTWEHQSFVGEHIRYLRASIHDKIGTITLPYIPAESERYQDDGLYVCCVVDNQKNESIYFPRDEIIVKSTGPPIFIASNQPRRHGHLSPTRQLKLRVYTNSPLSCSFAEITNMSSSMAFKHDIEVQRTNYRDLFHGEMVTVSIFETITDLRKVFNDDVQQYMITVCNEFGNSSYIEIQSSMYKKYSTWTNGRNLIIVVVGSVVGAVLGVLGFISLIISKRRCHESNQQDEIEHIDNDHVGPVENVIYQAAGDIGLQNQNENEELKYAELDFCPLHHFRVSATRAAHNRTEYVEIVT